MKEEDVEKLKMKIYSILEGAGVTEIARAQIMGILSADFNPHKAWEEGQCDGLG